MSTLLALTVTWDPTIRGILVVAVAVAILCGSIYLLLATNTGIRLGFLIALAGLSGWMVIMGIVWWIYGIGLVGESASWKVSEVVVSEDADDLSDAELDEAADVRTWSNLPEGGGDAAAAADEALAGADSRVKVFDATSDYKLIEARETGGKDPDSILSELPGPHPPHYAAVQVQQVLEVEVPFGETPPPSEADESAPVVTVLMARDIGNRRLPPAAITIASLVIFGVVCNVLHRRDKLSDETRARADAVG
ncbi:MAG: hypothetical protein H0U26_04540 [Acidimicrobiia bacterium]|nr:hypothetical protein [Acidimicrobiia bacterium]